MSDDLTRKRPEDSNKINIQQDWEVNYWARKFGVTEFILKRAVSEVGPMVADVANWLRKNGYI